MPYIDILVTYKMRHCPIIRFQCTGIIQRRKETYKLL